MRAEAHAFPDVIIPSSFPSSQLYPQISTFKAIPLLLTKNKTLLVLGSSILHKHQDA